MTVPLLVKAMVALFLISPGSLPAPLRVVDDQGIAIVHAEVTFVGAAGETDEEQTGVDGRVALPMSFQPIAARVTAPGYAPLRMDLRSAGGTTLTLTRTLGVIGTVRVATGSQRSLHQLPFDASVLDRSALAGAPATTSDGLLRSLPGVDRTRSNSAFTNYGQLRVSFDGAGNDRGLVFVDGIPAQDGFGGQVDWAAYPSQNITRVELLRGPGSALYGSGAIGGALELQTREPAPGTPSGPEAEISLGVGGFGGQDASAFARTRSTGRLNASLWASGTKLSYYDFPGAYDSPVSYGARSQSDATQIRLRYNVGSRDTLDLSGLFSSDAQDQGRPNYSFGRSLQQYALAYTRDGERGAASVTAYERDTSVVNTNDSFPTKPGVLQYVQHVPSWENGVSGSYTWRGVASELQFRAEQRSVHGLSNQSGADGALQSLGSGSQAQTGFALQETLHAAHAELLVGARYDTIAFSNGHLVNAPPSPGPLSALDAPARRDAAISPRAALRLDLTPSFAVRLSTGAGFRAPYLNELVRGFSIGKTQFKPNIDLIPERSHTDRIGIDALGPRSRLAIDVFSTKISDAIAYLTLSPTVQQRGNIERAQTDGTTIAWTQRLGACTRLRLGATSQYARVTAAGAAAPAQAVGKRPQFVPDRSATLGLDVSGDNVGYGLEADYLGQAYADDLNTQPLGAALVLGLRVNAPLSNGAAWSVAWQNITNQHYLTSIDRIPLPAQASVRYTFPLGARAHTPASCA